MLFPGHASQRTGGLSVTNYAKSVERPKITFSPTPGLKKKKKAVGSAMRATNQRPTCTPTQCSNAIVFSSAYQGIFVVVENKIKVEPSLVQYVRSPLFCATKRPALAPSQGTAKRYSCTNYLRHRRSGETTGLAVLRAARAQKDEQRQCGRRGLLSRNTGERAAAGRKGKRSAQPVGCRKTKGARARTAIDAGAPAEPDAR